jgi:uncharacterized protein
MKIVVVSDTHGDSDAIRRVLLQEQDADLYLHAGDVGLPRDLLGPFAAVRGNCDGAFASQYPFRYEAETPFGKLHMEHYPIEAEAMMRCLAMDGVRIFIHGHTHRMEEQIIGGIRVYCPGSISLPSDSETGTYLVLEVSEHFLDANFRKLR